MDYGSGNEVGANTADRPGTSGIVRAASGMAVGSLLSRVTGFIRQILLAAVLGSTLVADGYNVARTLPNQIYELLLGGALTSVFVPLLVRAQARDEDGGEVYAQRLLTLTTIVLAAASVLAVVIAPLLVWVQNIGPDRPHYVLTTVLAALLLPGILFYGIGALLGAILNSRGLYAAPAWAPVLNNLVVIVVSIALIYMGNGEAPTVDVFSTDQILVLGLGTTFGIVVQTVALWPAMRKAGFRWKWRMQWRGVGLSEVAGLGMWVVGYVAISQIGVVVTTRLAQAVPGGYTEFTIANLLFQTAYGVLGVSILTALMPRLSRAAAAGDIPMVKEYLATGTRLSAIVLLPATTGLLLLGIPMTLLFFDVGAFAANDASDVGIALAASGFGLLPFAIVMLQLRVFYAVKDGKTPTLINVGVVGVKVVLSIISAYLPASLLVDGLTVANSASFVVGMVLGDYLLRRSFGPLGNRAVYAALGKIFAASLIAMVIALPVYLGVGLLFGDTGKPAILLAIIVTSVVGIAVYTWLCVVFGIPEMRSLLGAIRRKLGRRGA